MYERFTDRARKVMQLARGILDRAIYVLSGETPVSTVSWSVQVNKLP